MGKIEDNIVTAVQMLASKAVQEAGYDKTIKAIVLSCEDATVGQYKVKHQDSIFYAFSTDTNISYGNGTSVYVLIPGNDMSAEKSIIGSVEKLGLDYLPTEEEKENYYDDVGTNCLTSDGEVALSSYKEGGDSIVLYDVNKENNIIKINDTALIKYLSSSSFLKCGGFFRTALSSEQQGIGDFGIKYTLKFQDNTTLNNEVLKEFIVDTDLMVGFPYTMEIGKRQYGIFNIDGANFKSVEKIEVFSKDFRHEDNAKANTKDIFISQLELGGCNLMEEAARQGCGISFITPQGTFFGVPQPGDPPDPILNVIAEIRVKGKKINTSIQNNIHFYWFQKDLSITNKSENYHEKGGRGWKCLNEKLIQKEATEDTIAKIIFSPGADRIQIKKSDLTSYSNIFKCVVEYNGVKYTKEIDIQDLAAIQKVKIYSDSGTEFYYDIGHPTLTCLIEGVDLNSDVIKNYTFKWAVEDINKNISFLEQTTQLNSEIAKTENELKNIEDSIEQGAVLYENKATELQSLMDSLYEKRKHQIVNNNTLLVDVSKINISATFTCSVYDKENAFIGTGSITLSNSLSGTGVYTLVITDGVQAFQYDTYGRSPASVSKDEPISITPLSFKIYNNLGQELEEDILKQCQTKWTVPIENSQLDPKGYMDDKGPIEMPFPGVIENSRSISYKIKELYDYKAVNNNIELEVSYKGMQLLASTNFTFVKTGEPGTNGTEYVCKIVPNNRTHTVAKDDSAYYHALNQESNYPLLLFQKDNNNIAYFNFSYGNNHSWTLNGNFSSENPFKVILYKNEEEIAINPEQVTWTFLRNNYTSQEKDKCPLEISKDGKMRISDFTFFCSGDEGLFSYTESFSSIIQCKVKYKEEDASSYTYIYTTLPLITVGLYDWYNNTINLKQGTGFLNVNYDSDGQRPRYNNLYPFTLDVRQKNSGVWTDLAPVKEGPYAVSYDWNLLGTIYNYNSDFPAIIDSQDLKVKNAEENGTQKTYNVYPCKKYNGVCVTNSVFCRLEQKGSNYPIGWINIPIYFGLNRYGFAHLNDWNGNSIEIDKDKGYILSPQMGAGTKEDDNSFTGVLMGEVQESDRKTSDIGVLGYNKGTRSFKLDSRNGAAIFGSGKGQIIIDPTQEKALIYSSDYFANYNKETGLPTYSNLNGRGMLIDLSEPAIRFGSGDFVVDSEGHVTAKGGGSIGGWNISNYALYSENNKTGMNSVSEANGTGSKTIKVPLPYGDEETKNQAIAFWAGGSSDPSFYVTHNGYLRCNEATIGSGSNKIYIGIDASDFDSHVSASAIYSGDKNTYSSYADGFYLGTNGFCIGSDFWVSPKGDFTARKGTIGAGDYPWIISENCIKSEKDTYSDTNNGVYLGTNGIGLGPGKFYVNKSGFLHATSGEIGGWRLTENSIRSTDSADYSNNNGMYFGSSGLRLGSNFRVSSTGNLSANNINLTGVIVAQTGSKIGGWSVNSNCLSAGNIKIYNTGSIQHTGGQWKINSDGSAYFKNATIAKGCTVNGSTVGSGIRGGNISDKSIGKGKFDNGVETWVGNIAANKIEAASIDAGQITTGSLNAERISGGTLSLSNTWKWDSNGIQVLGNGGLGYGWHTGVTFKMHFLRELTDKMIIYFVNGICVGYSQN